MYQREDEIEVTVIFLDCTEEEVAEKMCHIDYANIKAEVVDMDSEGVSRVFQIIQQSESKYFCFGEREKVSKPDKIRKMVDYLEENSEVQTALCLNEYIDDEGFVTNSLDVWMEYLKEESIFEASKLFQLSLIQEKNYFGSLENCMVRRENCMNKMPLISVVVPNQKEEKLYLMFEWLFGMKTGYVQEVLVTNIEKRLDIGQLYERYNVYKELRNKILEGFKRHGDKNRELPSVYKRMKGEFVRNGIEKEQNREFTFFYTDRAEYFNLEPLVKEATKRGYKVRFTNDITSRADIGVYCSHVGLLMNNGGIHSDFSVILLHDMTQGELNWPNLWNYEPWDGFDLGVLPGKQWAERWKRCSGFSYAHPRLGVYELGYPEGDYARSEELLQRAERIKKSLNLKYKYSVLYAPSWENDGKEDDFINAMQGMEVNLLIKHASFAKDSEFYKNICQMHELHFGKYDNLYYVEPEENILPVLAISDLVISDESSVMTEALLFGKPSISVSDWLIPDEPVRFSAVPFDYVYKCKRREIGECAEQILNKIRQGEETTPVNEIFSNIGNSSSDIIDLIEYYVGIRQTCDCLDKEVLPINMLHGVWD